MPTAKSDSIRSEAGGRRRYGRGPRLRRRSFRLRAVHRGHRPPSRRRGASTVGCGSLFSSRFGALLRRRHSRVSNRGRKTDASGLSTGLARGDGIARGAVSNCVVDSRLLRGRSLTRERFRDVRDRHHAHSAKGRLGDTEAGLCRVRAEAGPRYETISEEGERVVVRPEAPIECVLEGGLSSAVSPTKPCDGKQEPPHTKHEGASGWDRQPTGSGNPCGDAAGSGNGGCLSEMLVVGGEGKVPPTLTGGGSRALTVTGGACGEHAGTVRDGAAEAAP